VFLIPSSAVRDRVRAGREQAGSRFGHETSDPDRARSNLRERDLLLNARLALSCDELGLRRIEMDGSLELDASIALLEEHFRPYLPAGLNV
jgi:hypothetical protein